MAEARLGDAPAGGSFRIEGVLLGGEVGRRLADMGFTAGVEGAVVRRGLLGGPVQVRLRGYDLLLRRSEAMGIAVVPVGDWGAGAKREHRPRGRMARRAAGSGGADFEDGAKPSGDARGCGCE